MTSVRQVDPLPGPMVRVLVAGLSLGNRSISLLPYGVDRTRPKNQMPGQARIACIILWLRTSLDLCVYVHDGCSLKGSRRPLTLRRGNV